MGAWGAHGGWGWWLEGSSYRGHGVNRGSADSIILPQIIDSCILYILVFVRVLVTNAGAVW